MSRIEIAAELCKACELCMSVCPKECIVHSDTLNRYGVYPMRMRDDAVCTGCTQCATMCPDAAIEVYRTVAEKKDQGSGVGGQGSNSPPHPSSPETPNNQESAP